MGHSLWILILIVVVLVFGVSLSPGTVRWLRAIVLERTEQIQQENPEFNCSETFPVIVVLGQGLQTTEVPTQGAEQRLYRAAGLLRRLTSQGQSRIVILAGGPTLHGSQMTEAKAGEKFLRDVLTQDIGTHSILLEDLSHNTYENALNTARILRQKNLSQDVVVVTSLFHMPRAVAAFRKQGLHVCALAADSTPPPAPTGISWHNPIYTGLLLHEIIGAWLYGLLSWA